MASNAYTGFVKFPNDDIEEIDVVATDRIDAHCKIVAELERDYVPGGIIVRIVERAPGTLFI